jgi:hypothetical protein
VKEAKVLSACVGCVHAEWDKTTNGRRHPSGNGKCAFPFPETPLPKWVRDHRYGSEKERTLSAFVTWWGGSRYISYVEHHRAEAQECPTRSDWEP